LIGSGGAEEVAVMEELPERWVVVEVRAEPVKTVVESTTTPVSVPDELEVAFWAIEVAPEGEDVVARVILEVKVWYVPVGVARSVVGTLLVPLRIVMPSVLDDESWAIAFGTSASKMLASPRALSDAILPAALELRIPNEKMASKV
jgi:hypothetical protein